MCFRAAKAEYCGYLDLQCNFCSLDFLSLCFKKLYQKIIEENRDCIPLNARFERQPEGQCDQQKLH